MLTYFSPLFLTFNNYIIFFYLFQYMKEVAISSATPFSTASSAKSQ
jgi:hypothetical protein